MGVRIGLNTPRHVRQIETMEMTLLMSVAGYYMTIKCEEIREEINVPI